MRTGRAATSIRDSEFWLLNSVRFVVGESEIKRCPFSWCGFRPNASAHSFDNAFAGRQTDPAAGRLRAMEALEGDENLQGVRRIEALAVIGNRHHSFSRLPSYSNPETRRFLGAEFLEGGAHCWRTGETCHFLLHGGIQIRSCHERNRLHPLRLSYNVETESWGEDGISIVQQSGGWAGNARRATGNPRVLIDCGSILPYPVTRY